MKNLEKLVSVLEKNHIETDAIELAESIWLSIYISKNKISASNKNDNNKNKSQKEERITQVEKSHKHSYDSKTKQLKNQKSKDVPLHPISDKKDKNSLPFRTPLVRKLYKDNDLIFAFRHFRQKIISLKQDRLDEEKIADYITETDIFIPFYQKSYEKRFRVIFLVDSSKSMKIWESLIDEFIKDVKNYHIFKEIITYYLSSDFQQPKLYRKKSFKSPINNKWYKSLNQNSLIFMFSDMISKSWSSGELLNQINKWQKYSPFAIIQMLPQRLWNGTKLLDASMGKMSGQKKFALNAQLKSRAEEILFQEEERLPPLIKLPILNFDENSIDNYGKVMRSLPENRINGALFEIEDFKGEYQTTQLQNNQNAEQKLRSFYKYASTTAKELLELLAVVPLSLPIIKLVQKKLLPKSTQEHLSEIFMSNIINKEQKVNGFYQFSKLENEAKSVREELIKKIGAKRAFDTISKLSEVIKKYGGVFDFLAFVVNPNSLKENHKFNEIDREFARISISVLREMGGNYNNWATSLENILEKDTKAKKSLLSIIKWADNYNIPIEQLPRDEKKLFLLDTLNLQNNNIEELPNEIGNLINLKFLNISHNKLKNIPISIGNLINLQELHIRDNEVDNIPESIGNLINLSKLYLGVNKLKKLPNSIGNLKNLKELEIGNNQLFKIPKSIGNLNKLKNLWILGNNIKELPYSINNLSLLSQNSKNQIKAMGINEVIEESFFEDFSEIILWIEKNNLHYIPRNNEYLKKLTTLTISNTKIEWLPKSIENLENLTSLNISNTLIEKLPKSIGNLENLTSLNISNTLIEKLPNSIGNLENLTSLDISNTKIKYLPDSIKKLKKLILLNINNTRLKEFPDSFNNFLFLSQESKNIIKNMKLKETPSSFFENFSEIISWANKYKIPENILPRNNKKLANLIYLNLSNYKIKELPRTINRLANLSFLNVSNNNLTSLPYSLGEIQNLTSLDISFNKISEFPKYKENFFHIYYKNLKVLYITGNPLIELPNYLKYNYTLKKIYTHKNQLFYMPEYYKNYHIYKNDKDYDYIEKIIEENIGILKTLKFLFS